MVVIEPSQAVGARIEDIELRCARTRVTLVSEVQALLRRTGVTMETEERIGDRAEQS